MRASLYQRFADATPSEWDGTWGELIAEVLHPHRQHVGDKNASPSWGPYELLPGTGRSNANVVAIHAAVLDCDSAVDLDKLRAWMGGRAGLIYSTYSHTPDAPRCRVVLPLADPCLAASWPQVWRAIAASAPTTIDPACKDLSRLYARPYVPDPASAIYEQYEGAPLDWRSLAVAPVVAPIVIPHTDNAHVIIAATDLRALLAELKRGKLTPIKIKQRTYLEAILNGSAIATPGGRHAAYLDVSRMLDDAFRQGSIESIAELLHFVFIAHEREGGTTAAEERADFIRTLVGARQHRIEAQERAEYNRASATISQISSTCAGRTTPYTQEDVARHAQMLGVAIEQMVRMWLLRNGQNAAVRLDDGSYSPFHPRDGLHGYIQQFNAALYHGDVITLTQPSPDGGAPRKRAVADILDDYATAIKEIEYDLRRGACAHYDPKSGILTMPACHRRTLEPAYCEEIDAWLRLLAGPRYDDLDYWLTNIDRLDIPLPALAIVGPGDIGKSLLIEGLSRIYDASRPYRKRDELDQPFTNHALVSPIDWCEETLPDKWARRRGEAAMRDAINEISHTYRAMYAPPGTMLGYRRIVITANNPDILTAVDERLKEEADALTSRILGIDFSEDDTRIAQIQAILTRNQDADGRIPQWVDGLGIARHVAWLARDARDDRVRGVGRFGVAPRESAITLAVGAANMCRQNVIAWIYALLRWGEAAPDPNEPFDAITFSRVAKLLSWCHRPDHRPELLISAAALADHALWREVCGHTREPTARAKQIALSSITIERRASTSRWRALDADKIAIALDDYDLTHEAVAKMISATISKIAGRTILSQPQAQLVLPAKIEASMPAEDDWFSEVRR